jgi:hypothetical protein
MIFVAHASCSLAHLHIHNAMGPRVPPSCRVKVSCLDVHVMEDAAAAEPSAMVLALQSVQRWHTAVQLARAAAAAPTAASDASSQSSELQLIAYQHEASQHWHAHPRVWQAIGQLTG